jgi:hypothetical protein
VAPFTLWFGLLGAPAAWAIQTLVNLPISAHACFPRIFPLAVPAAGALRGILFVVCIAAIIVGVAALWAAVRGWQRTREEHQSGSGKGGSTTAARRSPRRVRDVPDSWPPRAC